MMSLALGLFPPLAQFFGKEPAELVKHSAADVMAAADVNSDGGIDCDEFIAWCAAPPC